MSFLLEHVNHGACHVRIFRLLHALPEDVIVIVALMPFEALLAQVDAHSSEVMCLGGDGDEVICIFWVVVRGKR